MSGEGRRSIIVRKGRGDGEKHGGMKYDAILLSAVVDGNGINTLFCYALNGDKNNRWEKLEKTQPDEKRVHFLVHGGSNAATVMRRTAEKVKTTLGLSNKYVMRKPSLLKTLVGAEKQKWHQDHFSHTGAPIYSAIIAVDSRNVIVGRLGSRPLSHTNVHLKPGDVLVFRTDLCHCGAGLMSNEKAIGAHMFLDAENEPDLGRDTFNSLPDRTTVRRVFLSDPKKLTTRMMCLPHEIVDEKERSPSFQCQLCTSIFGKRARTTKGVAHCRECNVTLCKQVCWGCYHDGVGLCGKKTVEKYIEEKLDSRSWLIAIHNENENGVRKVYE
jgi:hypothetical protein